MQIIKEKEAWVKENVKMSAVWGLRMGEKKVPSLSTMGDFEQKESRLTSVIKIPQAGQKTGLVCYYEDQGTYEFLRYMGWMARKLQNMKVL